MSNEFSITVRSWRNRRLVVFDPSLQPNNSEFIFLYFVEGHQVCARHCAEKEELTAVSNHYDQADALTQYQKWLSGNAAAVTDKRSRSEFEVENPPPPRKKCPQCEGQGTWFDSVNKMSYGVISEAPNIIERCPTCHNEGWVNDVL